MDADKTSACGTCEVLARIEAKLDVLIEALAGEQEDEQEPAITLDGAEAGGARDPDGMI